MSLPQTYTVVISNGRGKEVTIEQLPLPIPGTNQLLIKVAFAPINPSDILFINQAYASTLKPPYLVGFEGAGTVVEIGNDLKVPYQIGDRVHVYSQGTFGQYLVADTEKCRKIQDGLSFEDAAPHYVNPVTVVAMGDYVKKNGHKALIHTAGSSALGRMIIRYFKHKGIKTINIVRKSEFIEELKKEGADYVLNSQEPDFETQLKEIAQKENVTLAFDAVGGDFTTKVLKNQPEGSVLALYGALAGAGISNLNIQQFIFEGKTVTGFYLTKYLENAFKAGEGEKLLNESYELLPTVLKSNVQKVFGLEDIKEALALYQTNSSNGKILIKPN